MLLNDNESQAGTNEQMLLNLPIKSKHRALRGARCEGVCDENLDRYWPSLWLTHLSIELEVCRVLRTVLELQNEPFAFPFPRLVCFPGIGILVGHRIVAETVPDSRLS